MVSSCEIFHLAIIYLPMKKSALVESILRKCLFSLSLSVVEFICLLSEDKAGNHYLIYVKGPLKITMVMLGETLC
jgi:hypothetical protein